MVAGLPQSTPNAKFADTSTDHCAIPFKINQLLSLFKLMCNQVKIRNEILIILSTLPGTMFII